MAAKSQTSKKVKKVDSKSRRKSNVKPAVAKVSAKSNSSPGIKVASRAVSKKVNVREDASSSIEVSNAKGTLTKAESDNSRALEKAKAALKAESAPKAKAAAKKGRKLAIEIGPNEAASALSSKWSSLYKKAQQIEAKPYNMKAVFEEKTAIVHKVLGWGYILTNRNDRLEVLFKDGIKYLISNYKP